MRDSVSSVILRAPQSSERSAAGIAASRSTRPVSFSSACTTKRFRRVHERFELFGIISSYLVGKNESGNQKGNLSYLAGTKKGSDSLIESRRGSAGGRTTMALLRERERSDDNDARAFLLSNTAEERVELLRIVSNLNQAT